MKCTECKEESDSEICEECCDHSDSDDHGCLICGKDLTEDRMARAYDQAKDFLKYGDD